MKQHSENAISISVIGGADGPIGIFVAGPGGKRALKARIRDSIYRYKRKRAEKRIVAAPHSLAETVQYAKDKYGLTEAAATDSDYIEQMRCLKENLVLRQKPELLGSLGELSEPDLTDETAVQAFLDLLEARSRKIAQLPDDAVPMDFHLYKIKMGDGLLQMGIDYIWQDLSLSYSGNRAAMRKFKKTAEDLYRFYGVSAADIQNHSARYTALVSALCS